MRTPMSCVLRDVVYDVDAVNTGYKHRKCDACCDRKQAHLNRLSAGEPAMRLGIDALRKTG